MDSWIRDLLQLGEAAHELQREGQARFISTIQETCSGKEFRSAGGRPLSLERALVLVGGMERLATDAVQSG
ncbi:hypothetical protein [Mycobacteroides abscessus]|uniref:hypothetical protein n=1 Tax=Mycobacteroides abscessus TaxID=36809 RepID=UPI00038548A9|nr:hypothetical protein [Mycobacteroides abscessus]EPZ18397.1 hypothetical protein M879_21500 [Mycobacteroides abscessus V06705]MBN7548417.1 hypothetical protein [Mycobacteroides abscessus subsp. abscessus]MDM2692260.1 hypothetical protein [Mycobacteroides abscessus]MDM2697072.1 hypothetical protein [Mycobacteroides abscessus]MDM2702204.1 hypothetical protein [Mycobacteroides abscessus]